MSNSDLQALICCPACKTKKHDASAYTVQLTIEHSNDLDIQVCGRKGYQKAVLVHHVCEDCAHSICDWLLSLPNRRIEHYNISVRVSGPDELVDVPLTIVDMQLLLKNWLQREGDENGD